jgi:hypothetical protein
MVRGRTTLALLIQGVYKQVRGLENIGLQYDVALHGFPNYAKHRETEAERRIQFRYRRDATSEAQTSQARQVAARRARQRYLPLGMDEVEIKKHARDTRT